MCGACGSVVTVRPWVQEGFGESVAERRHGRQSLAAACNRAFSSVGVRVESYPMSESTTVRSATGRAMQAVTLADIVGSVELVAGRLPDPLANGTDND